MPILVTKHKRPTLFGSKQLCWFVGSNPSPLSYQTNSYYAHSSNRFWQLLFDSGFTPTLLDNSQIEHLPYQFGLIDLTERATKSASELRRGELKDGIRRILNYVIRYTPVWIATNGLTIGSLFLRNLKKPYFGDQGRLEEYFSEELPTNCETKLWILPSSSGRAGRYNGRSLTYQDKVIEWKRFLLEIKSQHTIS